MGMHCKAGGPVARILLSHGAPVPVSQPQRWANTNRLSFIAVWQKHTRLEQNPPKTTRLSSRIIQSPNIRGKQEGHCFIHHPTRIHPEEKHRDEMSCYCPTWLARGGKQDGMSFYASGWLVNRRGTSLEMLLEETAPVIHVHIKKKRCPFGSRRAC